MNEYKDIISAIVRREGGSREWEIWKKTAYNGTG